MFETRKQVRRAVLATTLALALGMAGAALAGPPAGSGGWWTSGLDGFASWWGTLWGAPEPAGAVSETATAVDLDGTSTQSDDPDEATLLSDGGGGSSTQAAPNLDPDG